jgi:hypothetical protein
MKCRDGADKALPLGREARTVRETRNLLHDKRAVLMIGGARHRVANEREAQLRKSNEGGPS